MGRTCPSCRQDSGHGRSFAFLQDMEAVDRRLDGIPGSLTEAADRGILHHKTDFAKQDDVALLRRGVAAVARDAQQRFLLAYRAYAAGHTLAAGLVAEEAGDAQKDAGQINSVVEGQNHARAQRNFVGANALEGERDVELVTAYEAARRA